MRKPPKYLSVKRPKLRQSWNIHNLYNLVRMTGEEPPVTTSRTFFQQKWSAKSRTRAYHGEHIPEKKWKRMFSRRLNSAVDMPVQYLAANDGSEQAAGRGSGLDSGSVVSAEQYWQKRPGAPKQAPFHPRMKALYPPNARLEKPLPDMTPLVQMAFAPLERRLDTAIFRAMFASSVRQARQFVVHGSVKVNGKKVIYPSYLLNPGDMFQIDIDKVMYATGIQANSGTKQRILHMLQQNKERDGEMIDKVRTVEGKAASTGAGASTGDEEAESPADTSAEEPPEESAADVKAVAVEDKPLNKEEDLYLQKLRLESTLMEAKLILRDNSESRSEAGRAKRLRSFRDRANRLFLAGKPGQAELDVDELIDGLQLEMKSLGMLRGETDAKDENGNAESGAERQEKRKALVEHALEVEKVSEQMKSQFRRIMGYEDLTQKEMRDLAKILKKDAENPMDETKPYNTPWAPRPYIKPWAFIPRYLEVNHNICAAVYLRHPVARKGSGEVPTPFGYLTNQLAHNWYIERG